jgi:hypothetical protein
MGGTSTSELRRHPAPPLCGLAADIATALSRWLRELTVYHSDPEGWNCRHFQKMLRSHAPSYGADRARSFGAKLVAAGHLTTADVLVALR